MRILILSQWFDPEPTFKGLAFAKALMAEGHQVQVLTGFPNYPGGKLYPGYRVKPFQRECVDGVSVVRVPLYPSHDASGFRRILNYLSFALSASILGPLLLEKVDVVYVYHPPATVALPAIVLKLLRGVPFVYDVQDLWPDTLKATGMLNSPLLLKCIGTWCRWTYRIADHVVVLSPGFKKTLVQSGVPESKVSVVLNWCDEAQISRMDRSEAAMREPAMAGRFNVVFAGTMGKAQALDAVLDAAEVISRRLPHVQFVFIGGGIDVERLKQKKVSLGLDNVLFLPRRPMAEIGSVLAMADALLVHLRDDPLFQITIPSKIQAYLAVGRPIIVGVRGDAAALVEMSGAGITCMPEDAESIADAVACLAGMEESRREQMGKNGVTFYFDELSLRAGVTRFEKVLARMTGKAHECEAAG